MVPTLFSKGNIPVIYRSNALAKKSYGESFRVRDGVKQNNLMAAKAAQFVGALVSNALSFTAIRGKCFAR